MPLIRIRDGLLPPIFVNRNVRQSHHPGEQIRYEQMTVSRVTVKTVKTLLMVSTKVNDILILHTTSSN